MNHDEKQIREAFIDGFMRPTRTHRIVIKTKTIIDHAAGCDHPLTKAARAKCRKGARKVAGDHV